MESRRRFKFIKELAQGGFGKVYLAEQLTGENFSSVVAIKLLHGTWTTNNEVVMRSRDEARLLGRLRHRNIVRVEDLTSINGQCAIVMEYLQGIDLKNACVALREQGKIFPRKSVFEATGAIAAALDAAYTHKPLQGGEALQVIHRDIKPSNAMITIEGDVKVLDFGTARASFENREAKTQMLAFGSQAYMAPERMLGEADNPSGDVFSLGITLYEMLTLDSFGKIPLRQERFEPTVASRVTALDLGDLSKSLAEQTRAALLRLLAYDHEARPPAAEVVDIMETLADQATDAGMKRFAREVVKKVYESQAPPQDPNDPYVGQAIKEDSTGATDAPKAGSTGPVDRAAAAGEGNGDEVFSVPPELAEPPMELPGGRPDSSASAPAAYASPPTPPRVTSMLPGSPSVAADSGAQGISPNGMASRLPPPGGDTRSSPRVRPTNGSVSGATSAPTLATGARAPDESAPAAAAGGSGKIFVALALVGLLGVGAAGALWFAFFAGPPTGGPVVTPPPDKTANLVKGSPSLDWSANAPGKGGAILRIPDGAAQVTVTGTSYRQEWDGSANLNLHDLEPGTFRTKVKDNTGSSQLSDFAVGSGTTCLFTLKGTSWEKGECR